MATKSTYSKEELKILSNLKTYATIHNDNEAADFLDKLMCREKAWRKVAATFEDIDDCISEDFCKGCRWVVKEINRVYNEMWEILEGLKAEDKE